MSGNTDFIVKLIQTRALIETHSCGGFERFGITQEPEWTSMDLAQAVASLEDLITTAKAKLTKLHRLEAKVA